MFARFAGIANSRAAKAPRLLLPSRGGARFVRSVLPAWPRFRYASPKLRVNKSDLFTSYSAACAWCIAPGD